MHLRQQKNHTGGDTASSQTSPAPAPHPELGGEFLPLHPARRPYTRNPCPSFGRMSPWGKCSLRVKVIKPETPRGRQSPQKASRGSVCGGEAPSRAPGPLSGCSPGPSVASAPHGLPARRGRAPLSLRHSCASSPSQRPTWQNGHLALAGGHCRQAGQGFSSQLRGPCPPTPPPPAPASTLPPSPSRSQAVPVQTPAGPPLPPSVLSFLGS